MAAATSRAILTRNSSQTRRGLACSSAASSKSSPVSPSIHFLIDSISPNLQSPREWEHVRYALSCRDSTNQAPMIPLFRNSRLGWWSHDKLKHIGHLLK